MVYAGERIAAGQRVDDDNYDQWGKDDLSATEKPKELIEMECKKH